MAEINNVEVISLNVEGDTIVLQGNMLIRNAGESDYIVGYLNKGLSLDEMFESDPVRTAGCLLCRLSLFNQDNMTYSCVDNGELLISELRMEGIGKNCKNFEEDKMKSVCLDLSSEMTSLKCTVDVLKKKYNNVNENVRNRNTEKIFSAMNQLEKNVNKLGDYVSLLINKANLSKEKE